jgi:hypothetical protein
VKVWVMDWVGYDVRGGSASVYSTLERAKAQLPTEKWTVRRDGSWEGTDGGTSGAPTITQMEVDSPAREP